MSYVDGQRIAEALTAITREHDCRILLAVESGSRAWGFDSPDSDYDVRFIYVKPIDWYLSISDNKRDVIEKPIVDDLDINGWDLRKALQLLKKSNPPLLEWLQSPIVYFEENAAEALRALAPEFYSPRATAFHYFHMAEGNYRTYLRGDEVWLKKYFYVLRPLFAMRWLEQHGGMVPVEFEKLVGATLPAGELRSAIDHLVIQKRIGAELKHGPRVPIISDFIASEIDRLRGVAAIQSPGADCDARKLDIFFRDCLRS